MSYWIIDNFGNSNVMYNFYVYVDSIGTIESIMLISICELSIAELYALNHDAIDVMDIVDRLSSNDNIGVLELCIYIGSVSILIEKIDGQIILPTTKLYDYLYRYVSIYRWLLTKLLYKYKNCRWILVYRREYMRILELLEICQMNSYVRYYIMRTYCLFR